MTCSAIQYVLSSYRSEEGKLSLGLLVTAAWVMTGLIK